LVFRDTLSQVIIAIDTMVSTLHGNVERTALCNHCLSLERFCKSPAEFSIEEIVNSIARGHMAIKCGSDVVSLKDLAPDILMSHLTVLQVTRHEELGKGGFGTVYRFALLFVIDF